MLSTAFLSLSVTAIGQGQPGSAAIVAALTATFQTQIQTLQTTLTQQFQATLTQQQQQFQTLQATLTQQQQQFQTMQTTLTQQQQLLVQSINNS